MAISNLKNNSGNGNLNFHRAGQAGKNRQAKKTRESQQENQTQPGVKTASFQKSSQIPDPGDLMKSSPGNPKNVSISVTLNNFDQGSEGRVNGEEPPRNNDNEISKVDSGFLKQDQTNKAAGGNKTGEIRETGVLENTDKTTETDKVNKREEKAQVNRIDNMNAAAANSPKKVQTLSQDSQLGTVFDAKG